MPLSRFQAIRIAVDTVSIFKRGHYISVAGHKVPVSALLQAARGGTMDYPAGNPVPSRPPLVDRAEICVVNMTTIAAARALYEEELNPVALNFASARQAGGGFFLGAKAQEESLCRASGLYLCIKGRDFYRRQRLMPSSLYTSHMIYSPNVPVIRNDEGRLLDDPWPLSIITAAAPNATVMRGTHEYDEEKVRAAFEERIRKVLAIGVVQSRQSIVLGAWGCGAFGNDPKLVAPIFARVLKEEFPGAYQKVVFAVLDSSKERRRIGAFEAAFDPG